MRRFKLHLTVLAVLALLLAACGGPESAEEAPEAAPPATEGGGAAPDAATEAEAGATEAAAGEGGQYDCSEPQEVNIALPARAAPSLDVYAAVSEGFFEDYNVQAEVIFTPGPAATIAAISGGSADVGIPFAEQALAAIEVGAPIKVMAGNFNRVLGTLVGTQDYSSIEDLRGSKIASSAPDDVLTLLTRERLAEEGLAPDQYDMIIVPSSEQRYQSLQSGAVGASVLVAPRDLQALAAGYQTVFEIQEPGLFLAHIGSEQFINERTGAAVCFVRAIQDAQAWMTDAANRDRAAEILVEWTEVPTEVAEATYDAYIEADAWVDDAGIVQEDLETTLQYLVSTGKIFQDPPDPEKYATTEIVELANQRP